MIYRFENLESRMQEVANNLNFIKLTDDEKHYYNIRTGKKYQRVTSYISDEKVEMTPLLLSSVTIGTKVDNLVRDYFDGNLKSPDTYQLSTIDQINHFTNQLKELKDVFDARGETVLPNDIVLYNDEIGVAGTVDLISYDVNGVIRIYDMKTMRGNQFTTTYYGDNQYKYYSTMYGMSNQEKHQRQISLYNILLNNTHGLRASAAGIIPIVVKYNPEDTTTKKLHMLPRLRHKLLDKVNDAEIDQGVGTSF
ncbi:MAG TPA: hypothetical protein VK031_05340 [Tissierellaceae bacterium]|nr:hypothetical protein [Tissierellaceae bacterium]